MMISLAIMIGSFRQTVTVWIDQTSESRSCGCSRAPARLGSQNARMPDSVSEKSKLVKGIAAVDPFVDIPIEYDGEATNLGAGDFDVIQKYRSPALRLERIKRRCYSKG